MCPACWSAMPRTCAWLRVPPPSFSRRPRSARSTCAAAVPARARRHCSTPRRRCKASMPSHSRAAQLSVSMLPRACRRGCASRAGALPCAPRACRSCRAPSCSTCSTAATRTGAATRPIATSAIRRPLPPGPPSRSAARARASAPPRSTSRAASARRRLSCDGFTVGALAAVNAAGSVVIGDGPWFWAAPFERDGEYRRPGPAAVAARRRRWTP